MRHYSLWTVLIVIAALGLTVGSAVAETSVYQWWQNTSRGDTNNFWLDFSTDGDNSTGKHSNGHYENGLWYNGDGYACIQVEWAGNQDYNHFGWFGGYINAGVYTAINTDTGGNRVAQKTWDLDGDSTSETYGLYEIFSGSDDETTGAWYSPTGDLDWDWKNPPDFWGFYLDANESTYFYSRYALNAAYASKPNEANGAHQLQVFDDPAGGTSNSTLETSEDGFQWVLCWEDLGPGSWGGGDHTTFDYGGSPGSNHIGDQAAPTEPDYQDMILTFKRIGPWDDPNFTPEPGTWLLLLASGAIGGWIRRRRND